MYRGISWCFSSYSMKLLEKYVDDAVGAVSVHGVCGVVTLAAGMLTPVIFNIEQIGVQMIELELHLYGHLVSLIYIQTN